MSDRAIVEKREKDPLKTERSPRDGLVEVGVVVNDVGRLSSELEGDTLQVGLGSSGHDLATDRGRTGESDLLDLEVRRDGGTDSVSVTSDDVDDTGRKDLSDEGASVGGRKGRSLGSLQSRVSALAREKRKECLQRTFMTIVLPMARAGPSFQANMRRGKFPERNATFYVRSESEVANVSELTGDDLTDDTDGLVLRHDHLGVVDLDDCEKIRVSYKGKVSRDSSDALPFPCSLSAHPP